MTKREKPEDTTVLSNPVTLLMTLAGTPHTSIENMEAEGQAQFVESTSIPTEIRGVWGLDLDVEAELTKLGFEFGDAFPEDPLFRPCKLPSGWKRASTNHSMHSDIIDEFGRPRVGVFYKAAFYDRKASASVKHCIMADTDYELAERTNGKVWMERALAYTKKGKKVLFEVTKETPTATAWLCDENYVSREEAQEEVKSFIEENFPDYNNPFAYWDKDDW